MFAKRRLIAHCTNAGIEHAAIDTFHDAVALLPRLLDGGLLQPRRLDARPQPTALPPAAGHRLSTPFQARSPFTPFERPSRNRTA